jgi:hypothetical protein
MAKPRPQKTSVDYVVIALSPLLIMVLVGSLCFFLIEVFYRGDFAARLHWIMFWFVVATVGIARISMEEGAERASVYSLGLVAAVAVAVMQFVDSPIIAWALMAVVWWCAHKLTWDCTLIDDEQDASGEGLLQVAGLEEGKGADSVRSNADDNDDQPRRPAWWRQLLESPEERRRRPHAPGVWVVYFSLAALPLFGLGQAFIPASDVGRRQQAFWLLVWYVASGMGLLLTTSFLGLRRYLRQRKLEMPTTMTGTWLGVGATLIIVLILLTMLVPRPNPEYPVERFVANAIRSPLQRASRHAFLRDSGVKQAPADATPGNPPPNSSQPSDSQQTNPQTQPQSNQGGSQPTANQGNRSGQSGAQQRGEQPTSDSQNSGQPPGQQTGSQPTGGQQSGGQQSGGQQSGGQQTGQSREQTGGRQTAGQQSGGQASGKQQGGQQSQANQQQEGPQGERRQDGEKGSSEQQNGAQPQSGSQAPNDQQSGSQPPTTKQKNDQQSSSGKPFSRDQTQSGQQPDNKQPPGDKPQQTPQSASSAASTPPSPPPPAPSRLPKLPNLSLEGWIRWLMWSVLAVAAVIGFLMYRKQVIDFLRRLWAELLTLLNELFGRRQPRSADRAETETREPPRSFAAFINPFNSGKAQRIAPEQLVRYTFEALEAWAFERREARRPEDTPIEFAEALNERFPEVAHEARQLARLYSQMLYARSTPKRDCLPMLQRLWDELSRPARQYSTAGK